MHIKKLFIGFIVLFASVIAYPVFAQKIEPGDIDKILLTAKDGSLSGGSEIDMELVKERGHWNSYQIMKDYFNSDMGGAPSMHSTERKLITTLTQQQIADFLNSIAIIKPQYDLNTFNLTPAVLIAGLRKNVKHSDETPKLETIITDTALQQVLAGMIKDEAGYDVMMHCDIRVVKNNGDILKLETDHMYVTMLPWKINGQDSYDMNINRFFDAAMGKTDYPNKMGINVKAFNNIVFDSIDNMYSSKPIASYRWNYTYADNVKLLKNNFTWIGEKRAYKSTKYNFSLQSKGMPSNINIEATVDITDRTGIERLIAYANFITPYLQTDNFVFKYYRNKTDCGIRVAYDWNNQENHAWEWLEKKIPYLKTVDPDKTIRFQAYAPDDNSTWLLLPNNKLILIEHSPNSPVSKKIADALGIPANPGGPGIMPQIVNTYAVRFFNPDGAVLSPPSLQ